MLLRLCAGCKRALPPQELNRGRCKPCLAAYYRDRRVRRGSTSERGYGTEHQQRRAALLPAAIDTLCPLCLEPMRRGQPLDLDHSQAIAEDRSSVGDRIVHAGCNRSRGGSERSTRGPRERVQPQEPLVG